MKSTEDFDHASINHNEQLITEVSYKKIMKSKKTNNI